MSFCDNQCRAGEAGFSFLEVLIAFLMVALAAGALLPAIGTGVEAQRMSHRKMEAAQLAETLLARFNANPHLGERGFAEGGFKIRQMAGIRDAARVGLVPLTIEIEISDASGVLFRIQTVRLFSQEAFRLAGGPG